MDSSVPLPPASHTQSGTGQRYRIMLRVGPAGGRGCCFGTQAEDRQYYSSRGIVVILWPCHNFEYDTIPPTSTISDSPVSFIIHSSSCMFASLALERHNTLQREYCCLYCTSHNNALAILLCIVVWTNK